MSDLSRLMGDSSVKAMKFNEWLASNEPKTNNTRLAISELDSTLYPRNQLLRDSDWASMAHGVELRTPLVDAYMLRNLSGLLSYFEKYSNKSLLWKSLNVSMPKKVLNRKKTGFIVPMQVWQKSEQYGGLGQQSRNFALAVANTWKSKQIIDEK